MRFRNPETAAGKIIFAGTSLLGSAALFASGCGGSNNSERASTATVRPAETSTLVFDDLGGGSSVIEVFPTPESNQYDGTYYDGDKATAVCKTEGRERQSDPSVGEKPRRSDEWVKIIGSPGESQYATAVYIEHPQELLDQLPDC